MRLVVRQFRREPARGGIDMAFRGVQLSYETIRRWCDTFGVSYAAKLKRRRPKLGDRWFLDEVFLKINGVRHYLWRAVDQHRRRNRRSGTAEA